MDDTSNVHCLLLALCLGVTSGGIQGVNCDAKDSTLVGTNCKVVVHYLLYYLFSPNEFGNYFNNHSLMKFALYTLKFSIWAKNSYNF